MDLLKVGDYVEGYENYGEKIARVRGWITDIKVFSNRISIEIKCDDSYQGARGNNLIWGNDRLPIVRLDKSMTGQSYNRFRDIPELPFIQTHSFEDSICVFDIDGTLVEYRFGDGVYVCKDSEFMDYCKEHDVYADANIPDIMKKFIAGLDKDKVYVCSKAYSLEEMKQKAELAYKKYDIPEENIFFVFNNHDKLEILNRIAGMHEDIPRWKIYMIDDSIDVLGHIQDNSDFGTIHISSLLDWRD